MLEIIVSAVYLFGFVFLVHRLRGDFHPVRPQTSVLAEDNPKQAMAA